MLAKAENVEYLSIMDACSTPSGDASTEAADPSPAKPTRKRGPRYATGPRAASLKSRITTGKRLLPGIHSQSAWARIMRDTIAAVGEHCGGIDRLSELQRLAARRIGLLETEMIHLEAKFARVREGGGEPEPSELALYCTLANAQRRACEPLGWQRVPRDVTPSLTEYLRARQESAESLSGVGATPTAANTDNRTSDVPGANLEASS